MWVLPKEQGINRQLQNSVNRYNFTRNGHYDGQEMELKNDE